MNRLNSGIAIIILTIAIDQAIKLWVESSMAFQQKIDLLPFFALFRTHNFGIAFSMFENAGPWPLLAVSAGVIAFVLWLWRNLPAGRLFAHVGFALIIGGAVGNMIDRLLLGYVVDYFLFHTPGWSFAIFNLADAAISVGAGLVILDEFLVWRDAKKVDAGD